MEKRLTVGGDSHSPMPKRLSKSMLLKRQSSLNSVDTTNRPAATKRATKVSQLDTTIVKSGYMVKLAKTSARNWKKRYFMLGGNTLTYYTDHNNLAKAKGDLLFVGDCHVEEVTREDKLFCLSIETPFHTMVVSCADESDRRSWKAAIDIGISRADDILAAYATKKSGLGDMAMRNRRFFILYETAITYHADHQTTSEIQGVMRFSFDTEVLLDDAKHRITIKDTELRETLGLDFENDVETYKEWAERIGRIIKKFTKTERTTLKRIENADYNAVLRGTLLMKDGSSYVTRNFILSSSDILVLDFVDGIMEVIDLYEIRPDCSVTLTGPAENDQYDFEFVSSSGPLSLRAESKEEAESWVSELRKVISASSPEVADPLFHAALKRIREDTLYDVQFTDNNFIVAGQNVFHAATASAGGITVERRGEWAIVTNVANNRMTRVTIGSAVTSVNGQSVMLLPFNTVMQMLHTTKTPMTVSFRPSPVRCGELMKMARNGSGVWNMRYFMLGEGKLQYKDSTQSSIKGNISLHKASITLLSPSDTGRYFCFQVISSDNILTLSAVTKDEMMMWAEDIYHGIAIANGGGHILSVERDKAAIDML